MSIAKHHAEWLSLVEVSGPFLSLPVLVQRFPQGMDAHDPEHAKALRQVYEEWDQDQNGDRPDPAIHRQWIDWVLRNTLDLGDVLVEGQEIPQTLKADLAEHGETLRPDKVVMEPGGEQGPAADPDLPAQAEARAGSSRGSRGRRHPTPG